MAEDHTVENWLESIAGKLEVKAGDPTPEQQKDVTVESKLRRISAAVDDFVTSIETHDLPQHTDVLTSLSPSLGDIFRWDGSDWNNQNPVNWLSLADMDDVFDGISPSDEHVMWRSGGVWTSKQLVPDDILGFLVSAGYTGTIWYGVGAGTFTNVDHVLKVCNDVSGAMSPSSGDFFKYGGASWDAAAIVEADISDLQSYLLNIVEDTTPQLGGVLDCQANIVANMGILGFSAPTVTIAGIQNQNLLDKTAAESISGVYTFTAAGNAIVVTNDVDINGKLAIGTSPPTSYPLGVDTDGSGLSARFDGPVGIGANPVAGRDLRVNNLASFGYIAMGASPSTTYRLRSQANYTGAVGTNTQNYFDTRDQRTSGTGTVTSIRVQNTAYDTNYVSGSFVNNGMVMLVKRTGTTAFTSCNLTCFNFTIGQIDSGVTGNIDTMNAIWGEGRVRGAVGTFYGLRVIPVLYTGGTLTNFFGINVQPTLSGGALTNAQGISIGDFSIAGTSCDAIRIAAAVTTPTALKMNISMLGGDWDTGHLQLGAAHIWSDGTNIRGNTAAPTSASDGILLNPAVSAAYTPTNVSADRSYDANSTTIDELADVVGTLIADLQSAGVLG